jgi:hypothetical protein
MLQKKGKGYEAISTTERQIWRSQALEENLLTPQEAIALTKKQQSEEVAQMIANNEHLSSTRPSKKRSFLGNQHTTPKPQCKPTPPAPAATLKKRCFQVEQYSSEKLLDSTPKVLNMESELEGVVGLLERTELDNRIEEIKLGMKRERYSKWAKSILRAEELGKVIQSSKDKQYFAASFVDTLLSEGMCRSVHQAAGLASIAMRKVARKGKEIGTLEHPQREILTNYSRQSIQDWHCKWKASDRGEC